MVSKMRLSHFDWWKGVRSNSQILKFQRFTPSRCKGIGIRKIENEASNHFRLYNKGGNKNDVIINFLPTKRILLTIVPHIKTEKTLLWIAAWWHSIIVRQQKQNIIFKKKMNLIWFLNIFYAPKLTQYCNNKYMSEPGATHM